MFLFYSVNLRLFYGLPWNGLLRCSSLSPLASLSRELSCFSFAKFSKKISVIFYILYFSQWNFVQISTKEWSKLIVFSWGVIESLGNISVRVAENAEIKWDLINFFSTFEKFSLSLILRSAFQLFILFFLLVDCWFSFEADNVRLLAHCTTISKWIYPIVNWRSNGECLEFSSPIFYCSQHKDPKKTPHKKDFVKIYETCLVFSMCMRIIMNKLIGWDCEEQNREDQHPKNL